MKGFSLLTEKQSFKDEMHEICSRGCVLLNVCSFPFVRRSLYFGFKREVPCNASDIHMLHVQF